MSLGLHWPEQTVVGCKVVIGDISAIPILLMGSTGTWHIVVAHGGIAPHDWAAREVVRAEVVYIDSDRP